MDVLVRPGDSLWYYSQLFNVPLRLVIDSNPNVNPQALMVGQTIKIPGYVTNQYIVQSGDSIWAIAQRTNMPMDAIFLLKYY